jgi:ATP-dependent helicase/nuclease subunit A
VQQLFLWGDLPDRPVDASVPQARRVKAKASPPVGNRIVVAGAGTGKTYRLVEECVAALRSGVEIDQMLIVTFTRAAAAELRERIAKGVQAALAEEPDSPHLTRQLALLDRAQISTLHSFCLELVSRHFSELGLSPRLQTLEGPHEAVLRGEAMDALFERYYEPESAREKEVRSALIEWFRGDDRAARGIIAALHQFTQTRPDPKAWFSTQRATLNETEPKWWREWHEMATREWVERWRPLIQMQPHEDNPARAKVLELMDQLKLSETAQLSLLTDKSIWPRGSKKEFLHPVKRLYEQARELGGWFKSATGDPLLEDWEITRGTALMLLEMAEAFAEEFANLKRERGVLDFHDLEHFSLKLLRDEKTDGPSAIAEHWRGRFERVFVDEYQDINQVQDRIIELVSRPTDKGNRFLVGDVKQSIYGFRQAEPRIFQNRQEHWRKGDEGECDYLVQNWRSHECILDFVNALFTGVMSKTVGDVDYDENARLVFADKADRANLSKKVDASCKVEIHIVDPAAESEVVVDENGMRSEILEELAAAELEAEIIAHRCWEMVEGKTLSLPNGKTATYGDIVILMRSAANEAEEFAKVFSRRGIPFDARRIGFFTCGEVLDLTNLLTILDNPLQDIPLLGVLRSPFGSFSLENLAQTRAALPRGPFWDALLKVDGSNYDEIACSPETVRKVHAFLTQICKWRKLARETSLAERLETILEETGYEDWALAQDRGVQRRANVRRLVDLARQFDRMQGEGLYPFLQYIENQVEAAGDIAPATVETQGAVRLMTVHQSKGLQFPIVFVARLGKKFNRVSFNGLSLLDEEYGLCLKARPPGLKRQYDTIAFWMARRRQEKKMRDEEMRILYVALTRAEHRLLLVGTPQRKKAREEWHEGAGRPEEASATLDWIGPWLAKEASDFIFEEFGQAKDWNWKWHAKQPDWNGRVVEVGPATEVSPEKMTELKRRLEYVYQFAAATQQEAKSSATALRRGLSDEPELARPFVLGMQRRTDSMAANELGQAAHRLLERAKLETLQDPESLKEELARFKASGIFTDEEAMAIDLKKISAFWTSKYGRELLEKADRLERELVFTAKFSRTDLSAVGAPLTAEFGDDEFIVVQGAADLVAILDEEIWLVDFKTDRVPEELLGARLKEYSLQLRIYALALSRIYKRPVTKAYLHFLEIGRTEWIKL